MISTFITLFTTGMRMSIGPFFMPILSDFSMTRTDFSLIVAAGMLIFGIAMPLAGYLENRFGPKFVLIAGAAIVFIASVWMVLATNGWHLLFSFGLLLSIGLAFASQISLTPIICKWFVHRRGQALFYLSTGSMAGIAIMNPVSNMLINAFNWQQTILIFGFGFSFVIIPIALFIIRDNVPEGADEHLRTKRKQKENTKNREVLSGQRKLINNITVIDSFKTLPFWQISIGLFTCGFSMNLLGTHGVPMLIDHGFSSNIAASAVGMIGLVAIPGTIALGSIADRMPRQWLLALIYVTRGIGLVAIVLVVATYQLYLVALIAGLAWAGNVALSSALLSDLYGVKLVGMLYGFSFFFHQVGATISTLLGGWAYETYGTHLISFITAGVLLFIASIVSLRIPYYIKKFLAQKRSITAS